MALEWYVKRGAERSGPITQREFEKLQEHLQQTDLLWRSDWQEWRPFRASPSAGAGHLTPAGLLRHLFTRDLADREIAAEKLEQYQYARVVRELVRSVTAGIASLPHWEHVLRERFAECVAMADELVDACNVGVWQQEPQPDPRDVLTTIWRHVEFDESGASVVRFQFDGDALLDLAHSYLLQGARSGEFELVLLDALAASEICRARSKQALPSPTSLSSRIRAIFGRRGRHAPQVRSYPIEAMVGAYDSLKKLDSDPGRCRRLFEMSSADGAEWGAPTVAILELRISGAEEKLARSDRSKAGLSRL